MVEYDKKPKLILISSNESEECITILSHIFGIELAFYFDDTNVIIHASRTMEYEVRIFWELSKRRMPMLIDFSI